MDCVMVILNYNDSRRALHLAEMCKSYSTIDKVVIVDNKSTDDSINYLTENLSSEIDMCTANENKGFAAGNNIGAKYAIKKYAPKSLLFANTDTIFYDEDVRVCQQALDENEKLGLVSMRMKDIHGNEENAAWKYKSFQEYLLSCFWLYMHKTYKNDRYQYNNKTVIQIVDMVRGSFMMFRTEALCRAGYFDEGTFLYYEEECISYRLRKINYSVGIITNHFYIHNHISTKGNNIKMKKIMDASLLYFLKEYYRIGLIKSEMFKLASKYSYCENYIIQLIKSRRK
jgi:GT2 family glycosyltransferase